ncbi:MAG: GntR family transcriptional regulator [Betaproteobacteria bacterium]|nr:GntR family transcriptional regulator [Betaproteobacteria bacterium]MBI2223679.1 GntR family transcriptional regulator [Betaproteobacteria bacterium]
MSKLKATYARSRVPLYIQVASALRQRIENGQWQPGQKISTLEGLEREFEVARVTVRQAVELLQNEGLVHRQQGRGTFVADKLQDKRWLRLETTWDSLIAPIKDNVLKLIKVDHPPALPTLTAGEGKLAPEYVFLRSVQLKNGAPYAVVNLHLERGIYGRDPDAFLTHTALPVLATLRGTDIEQAHQTLVIGSADPGTASLLQVPLGTPTAECHCVVTDRKDVAIYVAEIIYRNDCVKLYINLLDGSGSRAKSASRKTRGRKIS